MINMAMSGSSGISLQYKIPMRIALAQINPTVGDLPNNVNRMTRAAHEAADDVFPPIRATPGP